MITSALKKVFTNKTYIFIAGVISISIFLLSVWLPNFRFIFKISTSSYATLFEKLSIIFGLAASINTNFTTFSASYTIAIAVLFGVNVAMIVYYINQRKNFMQQGGTTTSVGGLVAGFFGIGCAACGTLVLGPLLALVGAGGFIVALPFGGEEFGVLGVAILGYSAFINAKKIEAPLVCEVD